MLGALIEAHGQGPHDVDALFAAGWPGETAVLGARRNRVYHAIRALRKRGLEPWLLRDEEGWQLSPALQLITAPSTTRS